MDAIATLKDRTLLIVFGLVVSVFAAAYWHYFQETGVAIIIVVSNVALIQENRSLRRRVKTLVNRREDMPPA